ncbi:MAG: hypothetical protein J2P45_05390 [Candidatus Dormibacteraeota bacterium]|nr:hypothetical protein [Candidatus Dormibacteraeota bacterium]
MSACEVSAVELGTPHFDAFPRRPPRFEWHQNINPVPRREVETVKTGGCEVGKGCARWESLREGAEVEPAVVVHSIPHVPARPKAPPQ